MDEFFGVHVGPENWCMWVQRTGTVESLTNLSLQ